MRILLVGIKYPGSPDTGSEKHMEDLGLNLRLFGNYIEYLSFHYEKLDTSKPYVTIIDKGIKHNLINDRYCIYRDLESPLKEVYNSKREALLDRFFKDNPNWDIIHIHHLMPLSYIEKLKKRGYKIVLTLHDLHIVDPTYHFNSFYKMYNEPTKAFYLENLSPEYYFREYQILRLVAKFDNSNIDSELFIKEIKERIDYGIYLLENVIDTVISNGIWSLMIAMFWGVKFKNIQTLNYYDRTFIDSNSISTKAQPIKLKSDEVINFIIPSYFSISKGTFYVIDSIKYLKKYRGRFKFNFWGRMNNIRVNNTTIKEQLSSIEDLSSYASFYNGYSIEQLDEIYKSNHFAINLISNLVDLGTTYNEGVARGVFSLLIPTVLIKLNIDYFVKKRELKEIINDFYKDITPYRYIDLETFDITNYTESAFNYKSRKLSEVYKIGLQLMDDLFVDRVGNISKNLANKIIDIIENRDFINKYNNKIENGIDIDFYHKDYFNTISLYFKNVYGI